MPRAARRVRPSSLASVLAGLVAGVGASASAQPGTAGPTTSPTEFVAPLSNVVGFLSVVGQSFTAGASAPARLESVQFSVRNSPNLPGFPDFRNLAYRLYVAPFDADARRLTAPPLFQSPPRNGVASTEPTAALFPTGGVALLPGQLYLAFLVPDEPQLPLLTPLVGLVAGQTGDPLPGGQAYTLRYASPPLPGAGPFAGSWVASEPDMDFEFVATPSAVPEPATWALVGAGLGALGAARVRRRPPVTRS